MLLCFSPQLADFALNCNIFQVDDPLPVLDNYEIDTSS